MRKKGYLQGAEQDLAQMWKPTSAWLCSFLLLALRLIATHSALKALIKLLGMYLSQQFRHILKTSWPSLKKINLGPWTPKSLLLQAEKSGPSPITSCLWQRCLGTVGQRDKTRPRNKGEVDSLIQKDFSWGWTLGRRYLSRLHETLWEDQAWVGLPSVGRAHLSLPEVTQCWTNGKCGGSLVSFHQKGKIYRFMGHERWPEITLSLTHCWSLNPPSKKANPLWTQNIPQAVGSFSFFPTVPTQLETSLLSVILLSVKASLKTLLFVSLTYKLWGDASPHRCFDNLNICCECPEPPWEWILDWRDVWWV